MVHSGLVALAQAARQAGRAARPRKAAIELTDAAVARIKELLEKRHKVGVALLVGHLRSCAPGAWLV